MYLLGFLFLIVAIFLWQKNSQRRQQNRRLNAIDTIEYPDYLRSRISQKYPTLNAVQIEEVLLGLSDYFKCCLLARKKAVAMPSQVIDFAWHELILNTLHYKKLCQRILGRFLHHTPTEAMKRPTVAQQGIKRAWRLACRLEGINPREPTQLPRLFALDALFNIENGFYYRLNCQTKTPTSNDNSYCASHISCSSCSGHGSGCSNSNDTGSNCGSSCGGGD